jgi:hypothetical protein
MARISNLSSTKGKQQHCTKTKDKQFSGLHTPPYFLNGKGLGMLHGDYFSSPNKQAL